VVPVYQAARGSGMRYDSVYWGVRGVSGAEGGKGSVWVDLTFVERLVKLMRTVETDVYEFDELSLVARGEVLQAAREINVDFDGWWDDVFDDAKTIGGILGIEIRDIYFSGFASQGDGACFVGRYAYEAGSVKEILEYAPVDGKLHRIAKGLYEVQRRNFYRLSATVKHSGHYYHKFCTDISVYGDGRNGKDLVTQTVEARVTELLRDFMQWIYDKLEEEYEYLTSDEAVIETLRANEYGFTVDGSRCVYV